MTQQEQLVVALAIKLFPQMVERFSRSPQVPGNLGRMAMQQAIIVARDGVAFLKEQDGNG